MSTAVAVAETELRKARAEEARQKREDATREIKRLRAEGAKLKTELLPLVSQVTEAQAERLGLHAKLMHARQQIAQYSVPLDPLTFPSDAEIAAHAQQLELWKEEQTRLQGAHRDAVNRESVRMEAVKLGRQLERVYQSIRNLTAIAEGLEPGQVEGGVFRVTEDLVGNTQMPPRHG